MVRTEITAVNQLRYLQENPHHVNLTHKWSVAGDCISKWYTADKVRHGSATGAGYDRRGAAFGGLLESLFMPELLKLAKRECKTKYGGTGNLSSKKYHGLIYNKVKGTVHCDGGYGLSAMEKILNKIGFGLKFEYQTGNSEYARRGEDHYSLRPVNANEKRYLS